MIFLIYNKTKGVRAVLHTKEDDQFLIAEEHISGLPKIIHQKLKKIKHTKIQRFVENTIAIINTFTQGIYKLEIKYKEKKYETFS